MSDSVPGRAIAPAPKRIVSWFSSGNNSAVTAKMLIAQHPNDEVVIARCIVTNEHPDNERFHDDCERWFDRSILRLSSDTYADCWDVWEKRHYISGVKGAPCTLHMKKAVRWAFERSWKPDYQGFGFSSDEAKRATQFRANNPDVRLLTPLIDAGISKPDCALLVAGAGILEGEMYRLGFSNNNNNCIGCAKATSIVYWARCRHYFPEEFDRMVVLSRRLGCRLTRLKGKRIFLHEIPADINWRKKDRENTDCGLLCVGEAA